MANIEQAGYSSLDTHIDFSQLSVTEITEAINEIVQMADGISATIQANMDVRIVPDSKEEKR